MEQQDEPPSHANMRAWRLVNEKMPETATCSPPKSLAGRNHQHLFRNSRNTAADSDPSRLSCGTPLLIASDRLSRSERWYNLRSWCGGAFPFRGVLPWSAPVPLSEGQECSRSSTFQEPSPFISNAKTGTEVIGDHHWRHGGGGQRGRRKRRRGRGEEQRSTRPMGKWLEGSFCSYCCYFCFVFLKIC